MSDIERAAALIRAGRLVAFPTETVYGLGANALDAEAVARIFAAKGRPSTSPVIVHVDSVEMARRLAAEWPEAAETLAERYWPGPLTLVVPKAPRIPDIVTAGARIDSHLRHPNCGAEREPVHRAFAHTGGTCRRTPGGLRAGRRPRPGGNRIDRALACGSSGTLTAGRDSAAGDRSPRWAGRGLLRRRSRCAPGAGNAPTALPAEHSAGSFGP